MFVEKHGFLKTWPNMAAMKVETVSNVVMLDHNLRKGKDNFFFFRFWVFMLAAMPLSFGIKIILLICNMQHEMCLFQTVNLRLLRRHSLTCSL